MASSLVTSSLVFLALLCPFLEPLLELEVTISLVCVCLFVLYSRLLRFGPFWRTCWPPTDNQFSIAVKVTNNRPQRCHSYFCFVGLLVGLFRSRKFLLLCRLRGSCYSRVSCPRESLQRSSLDVLQHGFHHNLLVTSQFLHSVLQGLPVP